MSDSGDWWAQPSAAQTPDDAPDPWPAAHRARSIPPGGRATDPDAVGRIVVGGATALAVALAVAGAVASTTNSGPSR